ncbi:MAG: Zn-ribbon domain-containing OB-fold protein [Thermoproteus sp.]
MSGRPLNPRGTKYEKWTFPVFEMGVVGRARYEYATGQALGRFLAGLKEGKILGTVCDKCGRVFVPPRMYCPYCFREVDRWVEARDEGTVVTIVMSYIAADRSRLKEPVAVGVIKLDVPGYKFDDHFFPGLMHYLCGFSEEEVKSMKAFGARVKARWKPPEERTGSVTDIECFEAVRP